MNINTRDATVTDPSDIIQRVLSVVKDRKILANNGTILDMKVDTICSHADTLSVIESLNYQQLYGDWRRCYFNK